MTVRLPPDTELSRRPRRFNIRKLALIALVVLVLWIVLWFLGWLFFNSGGEVPRKGHGDLVGIAG